ncbi:MAG: L,D-transpeptidase family protein [Paracoccaceae bacterium]
MTATSSVKTLHVILLTAILALVSWTLPARAQVTAFVQSVAEAAASDREIAAFYKANGYKPIWTGKRDKKRREAFLRAVGDADMHGLPASRYSPETLKTNLRKVSSERELGRLEVEMSKLFLRYARDIQTGVLIPKQIDNGIVREVPYRSRTKLLEAFSKSSPKGFIKQLPPQSPEYARLMKEKVRFEKLIGKGGWGNQVQAKSLKPGQSGGAVVQLRNRLIAMGYMRRSSSQTYDEKMRQGVAKFQRDHGLVMDGAAGQGTMAMINIQPQTRLSQIVVAMERERWTNMPKGKRHVWVNITDFSARIMDNNKVTFETRSVVGHRDLDRRTPEFSDVMEHMVINPTWNVPRSIAVKEYLPLLQQNPNAAGHMRLVNSRGQTVSRQGLDFRQFNERTFPFDIKQPPSRRNALGLVKFMFPNRYNIYLHDTPAKKLFGRETRAFSHGCVRLADPFDFAYALLKVQQKNPEAYFQQILATGREQVVPLEKQVPVHLVYRTAFTQAKGNVQFRRDVYGRDAKIWRALENAGVSLRAVRG